VDSEAQMVLFPGGDDQVHFTLGGGLVLKENLQFDLAVEKLEPQLYRLKGKLLPWKARRHGLEPVDEVLVAPPLTVPAVGS